MEETVHCPITHQLLQGDILRFEHPAGTTMQFYLGVIINADCDMANDKIDGVISFLPIYRFQDYLKEFWLPTFILEQKSNATHRLKELCKYVEDDILDLTRWINGKSHEEVYEIAEQIASTQRCSKKDAQTIKDLIQKIYLCLNNGESLTCIKKFAPNESSKRDSYIHAQITNAKKNMGDGHFFVSDIKGDDDIGFVIRMRRIYSIEAKKCFKSESDRQASGFSAESSAARISKFSHQYKFKLSQMFAYQYSRIGLPDEASELSNLAVENIHNLILEAT